MTLDEFYTQILGTVRRTGPPEQPMLFTWSPNGVNVAVLSGEDPVTLAHASVAQFNPVYLVFVGASMGRSTLMFFHAEGDGVAINQIRDIAHDWAVVPGEILVNPFERLLLNASR